MQQKHAEKEQREANVIDRVVRIRIVLQLMEKRNHQLHDHRQRERRGQHADGSGMRLRTGPQQHSDRDGHQTNLRQQMIEFWLFVSNVKFHGVLFSPYRSH